MNREQRKKTSRQNHERRIRQRERAKRRIVILEDALRRIAAETGTPYARIAQEALDNDGRTT